MIRKLLQILLLTAYCLLPTAVFAAISTVDSQGGAYSSVKLQSNGKPAVAHFDHKTGELIYSYWTTNGSLNQWIRGVVEEKGVTGYISFAFKDNKPYISYYHNISKNNSTGSSISGKYGNQMVGTLKLAYCLNTRCLTPEDWTKVTVAQIDSATTSNGYTGGFTSLAFDSSGRPRIAYYDYSHKIDSTDIKKGALKLAYRNGHSEDILISFVASTKKITRSSGSFVTDGFVSGNKIITDSTLNPGPFTIVSVTASEIVVTEAVIDEVSVTNTVTSWSISTVDTNGGRSASMVIYNNKVMLSYDADEVQKVKYAESTDLSTWYSVEIDTVVNNGNLFRDTAITINSSGKPRMVYQNQDQTYYSGTVGYIRSSGHFPWNQNILKRDAIYAYCDTPDVVDGVCRNWTKVNLATGINTLRGYTPSIKVRTDGKPIIAYHYWGSRSTFMINGLSQDLHIVTCGNSGCSSGNSIDTTNHTTDNTGLYSSMILDSGDNPFISYYNYDSNQLILQHPGANNDYTDPASVVTANVRVIDSQSTAQSGLQDGDKFTILFSGATNGGGVCLPTAINSTANIDSILKLSNGHSWKCNGSSVDVQWSTTYNTNDTLKITVHSGTGGCMPTVEIGDRVSLDGTCILDGNGNPIILQTEIKGNTGIKAPSAGTVAYYKMDEGAKMTAYDSVGAHNASLNNGVLWISGFTNYGLLFDGSNDYLSVPVAPAELDNSPKMSIEAWIKPNFLGTGYTVLSREGSYIMGSNGQCNITTTGTPGSWFGSTGINYVRQQQGLWRQVVCTSDGTTQKVYIDGILDGERTAAGNVKSSRYPFVMGRRELSTGLSNRYGGNSGGCGDYNETYCGGNNYWGIDYYSGKMDEVVLYNTALSPDEIINRFKQFPAQLERADANDTSGNVYGLQAGDSIKIRFTNETNAPDINAANINTILPTAATTVVDIFDGTESWAEYSGTGSVVNGWYNFAITNTADPNFYNMYYTYSYDIYGNLISTTTNYSKDITDFEESYDYLEITYQGYGANGPSSLRLYYTDGVDCTSYSETCAESFTLTRDSLQHTLYVQVTDAEWVDNDGIITNLRFDLDGATATGTFKVDSIKFKKAMRTWLDGGGNIGSAVWNSPTNDTLTVTLGSGATIATGDTIAPNGTIKDKFNNPITNTTIIKGSFDYKDIVALWSFESNLNDSVGQYNHGAASGGPVYTSGKFGNAIYLNGSSQFVYVLNSPDLNPSIISVEAWVKSLDTNWNADGTVMTKKNAYRLSPVSGGKNMNFKVYVNNGWRTVTFTADASFDIQQWHHYVGTYDGTDIKIYVDGVEKGTTLYTGTVNTTEIGYLYIGKDAEANSYLRGFIDEVAIYNRAIIPDEVRKRSSAKPKYAIAYDSSTSGAGIQAGDKVIITFDAPTAGTSITSANINTALSIFGKTWGNITAAWSPTTYPNDTLTITFAGTGSPTVVVGDTIYLNNGTLKDTFNRALQGSIAIGGTFGDNLPAGRVAYWMFDEQAGLTAYDSIGSNHGTLSTAFWKTEGKFKGLYFDGSRYVEILDVAGRTDFNLSSYTLDAWVRVPDKLKTGVRRIISQESSDGNDYWKLQLNDNKLELCDSRFTTPASKCITTTAAITTVINDGEWHHLSVVRNGTANQVILYVDGVPDTPYSTAGGGTAHNIDGSIQIGWKSNGTEYFYGMIDEIAVYSRVLTASEIQSRYRSPLKSAITSDPNFLGSGKQAGDKVIIKFHGSTNAFAITSGNIAANLTLSSSHTWGTFGSAVWSSDKFTNDTLTITLGSGTGTIASGDTITVNGANINGQYANDNTSSDSITLGGDFNLHLPDGAVTYWTFDSGTAGDTLKQNSISYVNTPTNGACKFSNCYTYGASQYASANRLFYYDFSGSAIDASLLDYGGGPITQNNELSITNDTDMTTWWPTDVWDAYIYTDATFARSSTQAFQARFKANSGVRSMIGWHDNGTGGSYADLVYAIYFNNGTLQIYEDGADRGIVGTYTVGTWYDIRIELKSTGAKYYYKLNTSSVWSLLYDSTYSSESPLRPGVAHYDTNVSYTYGYDSYGNISSAAQYDNGEYSYTDDWIVESLGYQNNFSSLNPERISVETWVNGGSTWSGDTYFFSGKNSVQFYGTASQRTVNFRVYLDGAWQTPVSYTPSSISGWHHYVGTYDGTDLKLYMDGALVGTVSTPPSSSGVIYQFDTGTFHVGAPGGGYAPNIPIDDMVIYNRALTADEVMGRYAEYTITAFAKDTSKDAPWNTGGPGIQRGDTVAIKFSGPTNSPVINSSNIETVIPLSNGHKWRDCNNLVEGAGWNSSGDTLTITFKSPCGTPLLPNAAIMDSITMGMGTSPSIGAKYRGWSPVKTTSIMGSFGDSLPGGRVAYWMFDEQSGSTAYDSIGNNHGTLNTTFWKTEGTFKGLYFDDGSRSVEVQDHTDFNLATYTIDAWVRVPDKLTTGVRRIISQESSDGNNYWKLQLNDNKLELCDSILSTSSCWSTTAAINDGEWHHVAVVRDNANNEVKLYIDGDVTTYSVAGSVTAHDIIGNIQIGWKSNGTEYFYGMIDEIAVYKDTVLTPSQIQSRYRAPIKYAITSDPNFLGSGKQAGDKVIIKFHGKTNGYAVTSGNINTVLPITTKPTGWGTIQSAEWNPPLNDTLTIILGSDTGTIASGDTITVNGTNINGQYANDNTSSDSIILGGDFNLHLPDGAVTYWTFDSGTAGDTLKQNSISYVNTPTNGACKFSNCYTYGASQYASASHSLSLTPERITVEGWVYGNGTTWSGDTYFFSKTTSAQLYGTDTLRTVNFRVYADSAWKTVSYTPTSISGWHHYAGTYDGEYLKLYVDGVLRATSLLSYGVIYQFNTSNVYVGAPAAGYTPNISIDDMVIYNRALTDNEVMGRYAEYTITAFAKDTSKNAPWNTGGVGIQQGDTVTIKFSGPTNAPFIDGSNIENVITLSNLHYWKNPATGIESAVWSTRVYSNDTLTITLKDVDGGSGLPDVAPMDTISIGIGSNPAVGAKYRGWSPAKSVKISGTFGEPLPGTPVAHYKMDENTGSIAFDSFGTNDGNLINNPTWITSMFYYGLEFNTTVPQFSYDFTGTTIDTSKLDYGGGTITQNGYLTMFNDADGWDTYAYSDLTFERSSTKAFQASFKANSGTRSMIGWHDSGTGVSYIDLVYAIYFDNGTFRIYEDGECLPAGAACNSYGPYTVGSWYDIRIELKSTGAKYYYKLSSASTWTLLYDSSYSVETNLKPGITHYDTNVSYTYTYDAYGNITSATPYDNGEYSYTDNWSVETYESSNAYMSPANSISLAGDWTVEAWFKYPLPNTITYNSLFGDRRVVVRRSDMALGTYNGTAFVGLDTPYIMSGLTSGWHHIAAVGSGSTTKFYIDGVPVGTANYKTTTALTVVGNTSAGNEQFGKIDEVAIYSSALTDGDVASRYLISLKEIFARDKSGGGSGIQSGDQVIIRFDGPTAGTAVTSSNINTALILPSGHTWGTVTTQWSTKDKTNDTLTVTINTPSASPVAQRDIITLGGVIMDSYSKPITGFMQIGGDFGANLPDGAIAYWRFDETTGAVTASDSFSDYDGTLTTTSPAWTTTGRFNNALLFDGTAGKNVSVNNATALNPQKITIEAWAKSGAATWNANGTLLSKRDAYILYPVSGSKNMQFWIYAGGGWQTVTFTADGSFDITKWHHYAGTYDGANLKIYVDGELKGTPVSFPGAISISDTGPISIGMDDGTMNTSMTGNIDEVALYNRALDAAEVRTRYGAWLISAVADDNSGIGPKIQANDRVVIKFTGETNGLAITAANIDTVLSSGKTWKDGNGAIVSAGWSNTGGYTNDTLTITLSGPTTYAATSPTRPTVVVGDTITLNGNIKDTSGRAIKDTIAIGGNFGDSSIAIPSSAVASDASGKGPNIQSGDKVVITFAGATNAPDITAANINTILPLSGSHSWLDGGNNIVSASWNNPTNTELTITLSGPATYSATTPARPTVAVGDIITIDGTLTDTNGKVIVSTVQITNSFGAASAVVPSSAVADDTSNKGPNIQLGDKVVVTFSGAINTATTIDATNINTILPVSGAATTIDTFDTAEAWTESSGTGSVASGWYKFTMNATADPFFSKNITDFDESYDYLEFTYQGYGTSGPSSLRVYYTDGVDCTGYSETCAQSFDLIRDSSQHTLYVKITDAEWVDNDGIITNLRFDLDGAAAATGIFQVNSIKFAKTKTWLDGSATPTIVSANWSSGNTVLTITLSGSTNYVNPDPLSPTVAVGDTILIDGTLADSTGAVIVSTAQIANSFGVTATTISNALASDASLKGPNIQAGDKVVITFAGATIQPTIDAGNIDNILKLNNGHSWLDGSATPTIVSAVWNSATQLTITLSGPPAYYDTSPTAPTVSINDTITIDGTITDPSGKAIVTTGTITGNFGIASTVTFVSAVADDNSNWGPNIQSGDRVNITFSGTTSAPLINAGNIDNILPLSGGHSWLDGSATPTIVNASWNNPTNTILTVTLSGPATQQDSTPTVPTVSVGDTITIGTITDSTGKMIVSSTPPFSYDFAGTTINAAKLDYGGGGITQNSYLYIRDSNTDTNWDTYVYTDTTFTRAPSKSFQAQFNAAANADAMIGWYDSSITIDSDMRNDMLYAIYFASGAASGTFQIYENGIQIVANAGTYTVGTWYDIKIELKSTGAKYYYKSTSSSSWILLYDSSYSSESNLRPGVVHYDVTLYSYTDNWVVDASDITGSFGNSSGTIISSAVANGDDGKYSSLSKAVIKFNGQIGATGDAPPTIDANNIDAVLQLNNVHSWKDGSGAIGSAVWSNTGGYANDTLTISLSVNGGIPSVSVGDTITLANATIKDKYRIPINSLKIIGGDFGMPSSAKALWSLNETGGTSVPDTIGTYSGTLTNSGGLATTWTSGKYNNGLYLDGTTTTGDYVTLTNQYSLTSNWTIEAWFKWPISQVITNQQAHTLVSSDSASNENQIVIYNQTKQLGTTVAATNYWIPNYNLLNLTNGWHHVAAVGTGGSGTAGTTTFYIDGVNVGVAKLNGSTSGSTYKSQSNIKYLGNTSAFNRPMSNTIDNIIIYDAALSADTIKNRYGAWPRSAFAYGTAGDYNGINAGDQVVIRFDQPTEGNTINASNIDAALQLPGVHTWKDVSGAIGSAVWNSPTNDTLTITLSTTGGPPTVAVGDTITLNSVIKDHSYRFISDTITLQGSFNFRLPTGAIAFWKFDDSSAGTAVTDSFSSNNGTVTGGTGVWSSGGGVYGTQGVTIDASTEAVDLNSDLNMPNEWTIIGWVKTPLVASTENAMIHGTVHEHAININTQGANHELGSYSAPEYGNTLIGTGYYVNKKLKNGWHQIAAVGTGGNGTGGTTKFYIDGQPVSGAGITNPVAYKAFYPIASIGNNTGAGTHAIGTTIDEISVYNRPLSDAEISQYYGARLKYARANDASGGKFGMDADDQIVIKFDGETNAPTIDASNIDTVLALSNGHSWRDNGGIGAIGSAVWNSPTNDTLTITLSTNLILPTVTTRDTITLDGATIKDLNRAIIGSIDISGDFDGAIAYYDLDEASAVTATDSINNNNGTLGGQSSTLPAWVSGYSGSALDFSDGNAQYVTIPDNGIFNLTSYTIQAWIKLPATIPSGNYMRIVSQESNTNPANYWSLAINPSGQLVHCDSLSSLTEVNIDVASITTTNGSATVTTTNNFNTAGVTPGQKVTGTGIAIDTRVVTVSNTQLTLSKNATASGTVTLNFTYDMGGLPNGQYPKCETVTTKTLNDDKWHFVAVVRDTTAGINHFRFYIDNALEKTTNLNTAGTLTHSIDPVSGVGGTVEIGGKNGYTGNPTSSEYFRGLIDDVEIYNYALIDTEVLAHHYIYPSEAHASNTSNSASGGIQAGDTIMILFNGETGATTINSGNISNALKLPTGKSWGTFVSAGWTTSYINNDTLKITLSADAVISIGTTIILGDVILDKNNKSISGSVAVTGSFDINSLLGTIAYWKFDENISDAIGDSVGSYNGTIYNGLSGINPAWVTGKTSFGSALEFPSSTKGYVNLPTNVPLTSNEWTIEAWVYAPLTTNGTVANVLINGSVTDNEQIIVADVSGTMYLGTYVSGGVGFISSGYCIKDVPAACNGNVALSTGWHHLVAVGKNSQTKFYIDGTLKGTANYQSSVSIAKIGNGRYVSPEFQNPWGKIDDVVIYNRALSTTEISDRAAR